jgi:hypothetical protein
MRYVGFLATSVTIAGRRMAFEIVGREEELGFLHAFLDQEAGGALALVLEGEAGIGKSTLWLAGIEAARERGLRVLSSRPAEAERGLAHVVLSDLFEGVLDEVLPALSAPRRHALEVALLLDEASEQPVDPRTLGVAVRTALEALAERTVVLAIDDVQWLDPSSASALAFALRRIAADRVFLLLARRVVEGAQPSELERALEAESVQRLPIGPLSVGALHRFLRDRLGRPFARQTLLRIHETSGGNPFFALELARALGSDVDPLQPLPVPETLEELVGARLAGLPAPSREALELASALGAPRCHSWSGRASRPTPSKQQSERTSSSARTESFASPTRCSRRFSTRDCPPARSAGTSTDAWRRSSTTRSFAHVISRWRQTVRTSTSPAYSTKLRTWRKSAGRRRSLPSSGSRRSG